MSQQGEEKTGFSRVNCSWVDNVLIPHGTEVWSAVVGPNGKSNMAKWNWAQRKWDFPNAAPVTTDGTGRM